MVTKLCLIETQRRVFISVHREELHLSASNYKTPSFYQKILAYELTLKRPAHELRKLNQTLAFSTVDLNPHQIDAALFAFHWPLSRGAILCDEVGL